MALLFKSGSTRTQWWLGEFRKEAPDLDVRVWPEAGRPEDIEFALVWNPPPGELKRYPNLKCIFSLGAGVDHLFEDPELPRHIPITRVVDANLTRRMTEFALLHVLRFHRKLPLYEAQQRERLWQELKQPAPEDRSVGVMGMGALGADAARALARLGFQVAGWSRTEKRIAKVKSFAGPEALGAFLGRSEIVVCMLPLTPETAGVLNARTLALMPPGSYVVNLARGAHVIEEDLLAALDSGRIAGAALDVFDQEPLPQDSRFWTHPNVLVTPHVASFTDPRSVVAQVLENIRRTRAREPLLHEVDVAAGY